MQPTKLADKAIIVKLTIRRPRRTITETALTAKVQASERDTNLKVTSEIFKDKTSPIRSIFAAVEETYRTHKTITLPYVDAGPRILPNTNYFKYTSEVGGGIARADSLVAMHMPNYDQYVQEDMALRRAGRASSTVDISQYPTAEQFRQAMSLEYQFRPLPEASHFLYDLSPADLDAFRAAQDEALALANTDVVNRMIKPLTHLITRLDEYKGQKGERWHDTLISNVLDGIAEARNVQMFPNAELDAQIDNLEAMAKRYLLGSEILKGSAEARSSARDRLKEAADRMAAYF